MPCTTCGHTMQHLGQDDRADNIFHCYRCGTVLVDAFGQHGNKVYVPKLVDRCRQLQPHLGPLIGKWNTLGIGEAINLPEEGK